MCMSMKVCREGGGGVETVQKQSRKERQREREGFCQHWCQVSHRGETNSRLKPQEFNDLICIRLQSEANLTSNDAAKPPKYPPCWNRLDEKS